MPRKPRIEFQGALYHVIARGNHRQNIFFDDNDRNRYLSTIEKSKSKFNFSIYVFVLMSNHVHLLIETSTIPLSKIMQSLHTSYTQYFNLKHNKSGHLFQGRYKAILCQKDSYLLQLVRYIHQNPIRAKIVESPDDYQWSSHHAYTRRMRYPFIDFLFVLSMFDTTLTRAWQCYEQFIHETDEELSSSANDLILGDEAFINEIKQNYSQETPVDKTFSHPLSLMDIIDTVAKVLDIKRELISGSSKNHPSSLARGIVSHIAIDYAYIPLKDVAVSLNRDPSSVSRICHKIRLSKAEDMVTQKLIESILKCIVVPDSEIRA